MKIWKELKYFILLVMLSSCVSEVVSVTLKDNYMASLHDKSDSDGSAQEEIGVPALFVKNGNIKAAGNWWSGNTKYLSISNASELIVQCDGVGANYIPFGSDLSLTDFVKDPVAIKVSARAENTENETPLLALQLDDVEGFQANANRPTRRIDVAPEFKDYYFDCRNIWSQNWPNNQKVDGRVINRIMFFINPGGALFSGKIFIREIQVVPIDSVKSNPVVKAKIGKEFTGVLQDFSGALSNWWGGDKFVLSQGVDSCLKIVVDGAGPKYESFSMKLNTLNMKDANKIKMKIRVEAKSPVVFRWDCKDADGYVTNANPAQVVLNPSDSVYKEVVLDFKYRWKQSWPNNKTVDKERVVEFLVLTNPGKSPWSGKIYIDDIEIIKPDTDVRIEQNDTSR